MRIFEGMWIGGGGERGLYIYNEGRERETVGGGEKGRLKLDLH